MNDIEDKEIHTPIIVEDVPVIDTNIISEKKLICNKQNFQIFKSDKTLYFVLGKENIKTAIKICD